jgi:hypothetical protein
MAETKLTAEEAQALRTVLCAMVVKRRTGELGIIHGAERFVSTHRMLKQADRDALDGAARKLGLGSIREYAG